MLSNECPSLLRYAGRSHLLKENVMTWTKPSFTKLELACEVTLYRHAR